MNRTTLALLAVLALPTAALAGKPAEKSKVDVKVKVNKVDSKGATNDFNKGMDSLSKTVKGSSKTKK